MMNTNRLWMVMLTVVVVASALAPLGTVAAQESSDDELTVAVNENAVTVESNDTAVPNATVEVSTTDENESYAGAGGYTTDADGTVELDEPDEDVTITVVATADGETASTTAVLEPIDGADESAFGALVSSFIEKLKSDSSGPLGPMIANFVVEHNPGNAPDHAGPPDHAGGDDKAGGQGPPDHAGGSSGEEKGNGNGYGNGNGPGNGGGSPGQGNPSD